jgi:hypothetical protein
MSKTTLEQKEIIQKKIDCLNVKKLETIESILLDETKKLKEIDEKIMKENELKETEEKKLEKRKSFTVPQPEPKKRKVYDPSSEDEEDEEYEDEEEEEDDEEKEVEEEEVERQTNTQRSNHQYSEKEMNSWGESKKMAWDNRERNQNRFLHFFNDDGFEPREGMWSVKETKLFDEKLKQRGDKTWGLFSKDIPGRNGQQCFNKYRNKKNVISE